MTLLRLPADTLNDENPFDLLDSASQFVTLSRESDSAFSFVPLQTTIGGSPVVISLTLIGLLITAVLALVVAYLIVRGYRRNPDRARLSLAIGLVLLTTGPIMLQLVLTNFTDVPRVGRAVAQNASKLLGLGAMLYAIYGVNRRMGSPRPIHDPTLSEWED